MCLLYWGCSCKTLADAAKAPKGPRAGAPSQTNGAGANSRPCGTTSATLRAACGESSSALASMRVRFRTASFYFTAPRHPGVATEAHAGSSRPFFRVRTQPQPACDAPRRNVLKWAVTTTACARVAGIGRSLLQVRVALSSLKRARAAPLMHKCWSIT